MHTSGVHLETPRSRRGAAHRAKPVALPGKSLLNRQVWALSGAILGTPARARGELVTDVRAGAGFRPASPQLPALTGRAGRLAGARLAGLWRDHRLFIVAATAALLLRLLAMLAFRPALFMPDSFSYLADGVGLFLGAWHPAGYPFLLLLLEPFHSLLAVTALQHLMGMGIAVIVYAVLRRWGLPAWGAVLAAAPVLFDPRQVMLESLIAADTLYAFLGAAAIGILLLRRVPAWWQAAAAGLLVAWASLARGNGPALIAPILAYLLVRRVGWRALAAAVAGFAVPMVTYMSLFYATHGSFGTTSSDGLFLWSRTMTFANCAVIKPPADLQPLCPDRQARHQPPAALPAWSVPALLGERRPSSFLWNPHAWWRHDAHPGFSNYNNSLGLRFTVAAIEAQPGAYAWTVGKEVALTFLNTDRSMAMQTLHFSSQLWVPHLGAGGRRDLRAYAHTVANTRAVQPYAFFLYLYQLPVYFPGPVFGLVLVIGMAGVAWRWRDWGGPGALAWAAAVLGVVVPPALHEYDYRFAIAAVPLACLAAGLAFRPARSAADPGPPPAAPPTA
jgi:hypothetical protein